MKARFIQARYVAVVFAALMVGCLDLTFPLPNSSKAPPTVQVVSPQSGATVAIQTFVSLDVQSPSGVQTASLLCGGHGLYVWTTAPYQATIDLTPCQASGQSLGNGLVQITLSATAVGSNGTVADPVDFNVVIDVSVPALTLNIPPHVAPHSSLTIDVQSDRTLLAPPTVTVGGLPASVQDISGSDAGNHFSAVFNPTPGLGIDDYDGGLPVPFEVLTETERSLGIDVLGRGLNGNTTDVQGQTLLSRVAWEASIPGAYFESESCNEEDVAPRRHLSRIRPAEEEAPTRVISSLASASTDQLGGGLVVPTVTNDALGWLPALFREPDGTYMAFPITSATLYDGGVNPWYPTILDSNGRTFFMRWDAGSGGYEGLLVDFSGNGVSYPENSILAPWDESAYLQSAQTVVDNAICVEAFDPYSCGVPRILSCDASDGGTSSAAVSIPPEIIDSPDSYPAYTEQSAASGSVYFGFNPDYYSQEGECSEGTESTLWVAGIPGGSAALVAPFPSDGGSTSMPIVDEVLPVGNGSFVATLDFSPLGGSYKTIAVSAQGKPTKSYGNLSLESGGVMPELLAARSDGSLLAILPEAPETSFLTFTSSGSPGPTGTLPGVYFPVISFQNEQLDSATAVPTSSFVLSDGSVVALLSANALNYAVIDLDANGQPRWLYLYPREAQCFVPELHVNAEGTIVYFVDPENGFVVSLRP